MANITFTIPSVLNGGAGEKKTSLDVNTLNDAFAKISETMGDDFKRRVLNDDGTPRSLINIYINGKNAKFSSGLDTALSDGDEINILPAVAGGSNGAGGEVSDLSEKELDRYSRQIMLEEIGYQGQLKLKQAKVCVVGVGGAVLIAATTNNGALAAAPRGAGCCLSSRKGGPHHARA